jgi:hypothetical protein
MGLMMVEATDPGLADLAKRLPKGRLHASGRGLVPYVKGDLYVDLVAVTVFENWRPPANHEIPVQNLPRTWDEIAPGHLVIARETLECGWWEAVVIERNGDLVTLRYRDNPGYPNQVRHRTVVASTPAGLGLDETARPGRMMAGKRELLAVRRRGHR